MRITLTIIIFSLILGCSSNRFEKLKIKSEELYHNNDCKSALEFIDRAIQINSSNPIAYNDRASYYLCLNKLDLAFDDINKAINLDPNYNQALVNRANLYFRIKEYNKSIIDLTKAYDDNYELQNTIYYLILSHESAGHLNKALEYCNESIESFSDSLIYLKRAVINYDLKKINEAYTDAIIYQQYDSSDKNLYILLGKIKNKEERHNEAIKNYKKCIEINPESSDAYYNIGYTYFEMDSFKNAFFNTKLALKYDTTNLIYYQLGRIEEFRKNHQNAIDYLTKAIEIDSLDAKSYFARGINFGLIAKHQLLYNDLQKAFSLGYTKEKYNKQWWQKKRIYLKDRYNIIID